MHSKNAMPNPPTLRFKLVFALLMAAMVVLVATFFVTLINSGGLVDGFWSRWAKAYITAYVAAVPVIYFWGPQARKLAARWTK